MNNGTIPAGFHAALIEVIRGRSSQTALTCIINHAHRLALAYLRVASVSLLGVFQRLGVSPEDAAFDAIGELFARDEKNSFLVLARWWKSVPPATKANDELLSLAYRRLVIGAVHQRVFQSYHDADPHLAKIIRNIKLALRRHPSVKLLKDRGATVLTPRGCRSLRLALPFMPHQLLLPEIFDVILPRASLKEMLDAIGRVLMAQKEYRRVIPLVEAAVLIREVYFSDASWSTTIQPSDGLSEGEIGTMINSSVRAVRHSTLANYQHRGVLSQEETCACENALSDILRHYYLNSDGHNGAEETFFGALQRHMPGLTRAHYRRKHRVILEYLVKNGMVHLRREVRTYGK